MYEHKLILIDHLMVHSKTQNDKSGLCANAKKRKEKEKTQFTSSQSPFGLISPLF